MKIHLTQEEIEREVRRLNEFLAQYAGSPSTENYQEIVSFFRTVLTTHIDEIIIRLVSLREKLKGESDQMKRWTGETSLFFSFTIEKIDEILSLIDEI